MKIKREIVIGVICGCAGFVFGWLMGFSWMLEQGADMAIKVLNISIDSEVFKQLIMKYSAKG